jgi:hypothetical protein
MAASGLVLAATLVACGSDKKAAQSPTTPSTPAPTSVTPTPAPPTPTPPPVTGGGSTASCQRLTLGTGTDRNCRQESGLAYRDAVEQAVDSAPAEAVEGNEVVWIGGYFDHIVKTLDQQGICAVQEGDNLFVRGVGDDFNEYYDVLTSGGGISSRYTNTCRPPVATPQAPVAVVRDPQCKLPASYETICLEEGGVFSEIMRDCIEALLAEDRARPTPIIFDFSQSLGGVEGGYKIIDAERYHQGVVDKLHAKGFCAWWDGEDIQVKNSNRFSEHYDIYKAEGYRIQLFTATCRDAAF